MASASFKKKEQMRGLNCAARLKLVRSITSDLKLITEIQAEE